MKDKRHLVLYSGGLSSFMTAWILYHQHPAKDIQLVFTDTKTEDADLYRFIKETSEYMGLELVTLSDGRDIWQVFEDVKFMGNNRIDPCSRILKREIFRKWLEKSYRPDECILYYGIGWSEIHRVKRLVKGWRPYRIKTPLCKSPYYTAKEIKWLLTAIGIKTPRLYDLGFPHNNCGGFCVKTGQAQFKLLLEKMPERYAEHEQKQEALFKSIGKHHGFIRKSSKGVTRYMSLKQFREYLEADGKIDQYDFGGCACFS